MIVIALVGLMGLKNQTNETRNIMLLVFVIHFFNTGPFLVLINADLSDFGLSFLSTLRRGIYTDFT
jgi:hypothetical protein